MYYYGRGVEQDCAKGLEYCQLAIQQGNGDLQFDLSNMDK
ncbi:hypothetical protein SASC598O11_001670, partial [Snodgrassella alvi SCGC AB-598-O11]